MLLKFKDVIETLPDITNLEKIELYDIEDNFTDKIDNLPGTQGSLKVYFYLYKTFKVINFQAAQKGLELFAEYTNDAKKSPGSHPNIDRLINIIKSKNSLKMKVIPR